MSKPFVSVTSAKKNKRTAIRVVHDANSERFKEKISIRLGASTVSGDPSVDFRFRLLDVLLLALLLADCATRQMCGFNSENSPSHSRSVPSYVK